MIEEFKDQKEVQVVVFRLGNEEYTVPIMNIQEIIMKQTPNHIPKAPAWVEGVINLRGHIIPIVDGKKKFALEDSKTKKNDERIIIINVEKDTIGLIVDEVSEVIHLNTNDIDETPVDTGEESDFIMGIGKYQNRLLILINPIKFLSKTEAKDLLNLSKVTESISQKNEMNAVLTK